MKKDNSFMIDRYRLGDEDSALKINCLSESGGRKYSNIKGDIRGIEEISYSVFRNISRSPAGYSIRQILYFYGKVCVTLLI